jgi:hypothetical protein
MYRRTQIGWVTLLSLGAATVYLTVLAIIGRGDPVGGVPLFMCLLLAALTVVFSTLTVAVDEEAIEVIFGPGPIRKRIPLDQVTGCQEVSNRWWYGWGIRLTPHGWLYNVSGLQAVELALRNGGRFRIGTDDPERLCQAIRANLPR